jgi:hypothetical protein
MSSSQHWHSKDFMSGGKDFKYIKYNNCAFARGISQNFNDLTSNDTTTLK